MKKLELYEGHTLLETFDGARHKSTSDARKYLSSLKDKSSSERKKGMDRAIGYDLNELADMELEPFMPDFR